MNPVEIKNNKGHGLQFGQLKRKYCRARIPGFIVDLADGKKIIGGIVETLSTGGFEITNLPKSFAAEKHTYTAVLSGGGKHYKMLAKPCWKKEKGKNYLNIGFKILDAPWKWVEFTMNEIPEIDGNKKSRLQA